MLHCLLRITSIFEAARKTRLLALHGLTKVPPGDSETPKVIAYREDEALHVARPCKQACLEEKSAAPVLASMRSFYNL